MVVHRRWCAANKTPGGTNLSDLGTVRAGDRSIKYILEATTTIKQTPVEAVLVGFRPASDGSPSAVDGRTIFYPMTRIVT